MDIWKKMYEYAKKEYHPQEVTPFIYTHHVVCALEAEDGQLSAFVLKAVVVF